MRSWGSILARGYCLLAALFSQRRNSQSLAITELSSEPSSPTTRAKVVVDSFDLDRADESFFSVTRGSESIGRIQLTKLLVGHQPRGDSPLVLAPESMNLRVTDAYTFCLETCFYS